MSSLKPRANFHQISHGTFCRSGTNNLFKWFCTIEQDGCHAHIWQNTYFCFLSRTKKASKLNLGILHRGRKIYQVCSNDNPRMTFDFLRHCRISVLVAVAILEECCMASADSLSDVLWAHMSLTLRFILGTNLTYYLIRTKK